MTERTGTSLFGQPWKSLTKLQGLEAAHCRVERVFEEDVFPNISMGNLCT